MRSISAWPSLERSAGNDAAVAREGWGRGDDCPGRLFTFGGVNYKTTRTGLVGSRGGGRPGGCESKRGMQSTKAEARAK